MGDPVDGDNVRTRHGAPLRIDHPLVGELGLNREKLAIGGTAGPMLVIYHPDAGSEHAEKLALLASMAATPHGGDGSGGAGEQLNRITTVRP